MNEKKFPLEIASFAMGKIKLGKKINISLKSFEILFLN